MRFEWLHRNRPLRRPDFEMICPDCWGPVWIGGSFIEGEDYELVNDEYVHVDCLANAREWGYTAILEASRIADTHRRFELQEHSRLRRFYRNIRLGRRAKSGRATAYSYVKLGRSHQRLLSILMMVMTVIVLSGIAVEIAFGTLVENTMMVGSVVIIYTIASILFLDWVRRAKADVKRFAERLEPKHILHDAFARLQALKPRLNEPHPLSDIADGKPYADFIAYVGLAASDIGCAYETTHRAGEYAVEAWEFYHSPGMMLIGGEGDARIESMLSHAVALACGHKDEIEPLPPLPLESGG